MATELCGDLENTMLVEEQRMKFEEMLDGKSYPYQDGFTEFTYVITGLLSEPRFTEYLRGALEALRYITYNLTKLLNETEIT